MVKNGYIFVALMMLGVFLTSVNSSLQCWRCSSDATNGGFCDDPFKLELVSPQQRQWSYVNCSYPYGFNSGPNQNIRPVCKKLVQEIYDKTIVSRSCFWEDANDLPDKCQHDNFPSYVKTIYCRTCNTDGCNGATGFYPIAAIILIPAIVAKILCL